MPEKNSAQPRSLQQDTAESQAGELDALASLHRPLTKADIDAVRHIEGFPIGSDEDIIALSDPPYYTACPNPFLGDFIRAYGKSYAKRANSGANSVQMYAEVSTFAEAWYAAEGTLGFGMGYSGPDIQVAVTLSVNGYGVGQVLATGAGTNSGSARSDVDVKAFAQNQTTSQKTSDTIVYSKELSQSSSIVPQVPKDGSFGFDKEVNLGNLNLKNNDGMIGVADLDIQAYGKYLGFGGSRATANFDDSAQAYDFTAYYMDVRILTSNVSWVNSDRCVG